MYKKSKLINIICGMSAGILLAFAIISVMIFMGVLSVGKTELTFVTNSAEAIYNGTPLTNHTWSMTKGNLKRGHELKVEFKSEQTSVGECENKIEVRIYDEIGADVTNDYKINYEFGTIKVNPRLLVITTASAYKDYDGRPLTKEEYEISAESDGVLKNQKLFVAIIGAITNPGQVSNSVSDVKVFDRFGADVTRNYQLIIREGILSVIDPNDNNAGGGGSGGGAGSGPDDGSGDKGPLESEDSHGINSSLTNTPVMQDAILFSIFSEVEDRVYLRVKSHRNYTGKGWDDAEIYPELIDGELAASYLTAMALENQGESANELKITSHCGLYALPYYTAPHRGTCDIQTDDTASTGDASDIYTAWYFSDEGYNILVNEALINYELNYRDFVCGEYLYVDDETLDYMNGLIVKHSLAKDDPDIINKVAYLIKHSAKYNLKYNPGLDEEENIVVAFLDSYKEGVCRHYASAATLLFRALGIPARYTVGAAAQTEPGQWVNVTAEQAHAWVEVYIDGVGWVVVEVTGSLSGEGGEGGENDPDEVMKATLTPSTVRKQYDGTPLYAENTIKGFEKYEKLGYWYTVTVIGERTSPGKSESVIEAINIYDAYGEPADHLFEIELKKGTVHVYEDVIFCISSSMIMEYNGKAPELHVSCGSFLDESLRIEFTSTADSKVGTHLNTFNAKILDEQNNDISDRYWIQKEYGKVTIEPRSLTIKATDAQKVYDGTPLTSQEYIIVSGELAEGHTIALITMSGSQTEMGRSENLISYVKILDEQQREVTSNYYLIYQPGTLKVTFK